MRAQVARASTAAAPPPPPPPSPLPAPRPHTSSQAGMMRIREFRVHSAALDGQPVVRSRFGQTRARVWRAMRERTPVHSLFFSPRLAREAAVPRASPRRLRPLPSSPRAIVLPQSRRRRLSSFLYSSRLLRRLARSYTLVQLGRDASGEGEREGGATTGLYTAAAAAAVPVRLLGLRSLCLRCSGPASSRDSSG